MKKLSLFSAVLILCLALFAGCARGGAVISSGVPESFEGFVTLVADDPDALKGLDEEKIADVNADIPAPARANGTFVLHKGKKVHIKICLQ